MPNKLPVARIISVAVNLSPREAQAQSTSNLLVLGTSAIIDTEERYREYSDLAGIAIDFGTSAEEYLAAQKWFGQSPQPTEIIIGRWAKTAASGGLRCGPLTTAEQALANWTAIVAGSFKITVDGGAATDITGLDFSGAANLNAVAALIEAELVGVQVVWNSTYHRFEFTSDATGATSAVAFLQAAATGTDISLMLKGRSTSDGAYVFAGVAAESIDDALAIFDDRIPQLWYGVGAPSAEDADHLLAAAFIEASGYKHTYGYTTQDADVLNPAASSDICSQLKALGYNRTTGQYSSTSAYAVFSLLGRILPVDYDGTATVITMKFKQEPGVEAEELTVTQANALKDKNCNVFVAYSNDTNIVEQGVMASGVYMDEVFGTDWLALDIQTRVYNILYTTTTKVPQTDQGVQLLQTGIEASCAQGVNNGLLAPGIWTKEGFGTLKAGDYLQKGYYVYAQPISEQSPEDRAARKAPPFKVAAKLAGAIHSADVEILVNR